MDEYDRFSLKTRMRLRLTVLCMQPSALVTVLEGARTRKLSMKAKEAVIFIKMKHIAHRFQRKYEQNQTSVIQPTHLQEA